MRPDSEQKTFIRYNQRVANIVGLVLIGSTLLGCKEAKSTPVHTPTPTAGASKDVPTPNELTEQEFNGILEFLVSENTKDIPNYLKGGNYTGLIAKDINGNDIDIYLVKGKKTPLSIKRDQAEHHLQSYLIDDPKGWTIMIGTLDKTTLQNGNYLSVDLFSGGVQIFADGQPKITPQKRFQLANYLAHLTIIGVLPSTDTNPEKQKPLT